MNDDWRVTFSGKLFEILQNEKGWEKAARSPGTRIIIDDEKSGKILLTREFRAELAAYDFRLPGGKVFDSLAEFETFRSGGDDILQPATAKIIAETREEAGYEIYDPKLYDVSILGATISWDLYVFVATDFAKSSAGQNLEDGEDIETDLWFSYDEVKQMIMKKQFQEDRIAMIVLRYLSEKEEK